MNNCTFEISIIGAAQSLGCSCDGVQLGPDCLRQLGLIKLLNSPNIKISDIGNIYNDWSIKSSDNKSLKNLEQIADFNKRLSSVVHSECISGKFPLVLGGDHSIGIGTVCGVSKSWGIEDTCVIWIDAHTDINTQDTTPTGNIHGMTIASLLGMGNASLSAMCRSGAKIKPENIIYVAARDIDEGEEIIIRENDISVIRMDVIKNDGVETACLQLQKILNNIDAKNIYLSIDIDVIDPLIAPGTGVPVPDGINKDILFKFIEVIAQTGKVYGAELVEVNPQLDTNDKKTALLAIDIIEYLIKEIAANR